MLPAGVVERVEPDTKKVFLACSKEQVKNAPDYDEARRDESSYRDEVGNYWSHR